MNNFSHKKRWNAGTVQVYLESPPIPLIKNNNDDKSDKYFDKIKFCRDTTPEKLGLFGLKMVFFDNDEPEDFFFSFVTST